MKKREVDIFGVLVGLVVGCILGFFLSTRINIEMPNNKDNDTDSEVMAQVGYVYLLQVNKTSSPTTALDIINNLKNKNLNGVAVTVGSNYYIYGAIGGSEAELKDIQSLYNEKGFVTIIKSEYILDKPNSVIEDSKEFAFYTECVKNLISSLKKEAITISSETKTNPYSLEIFSAFLALQSIENDKLSAELKLSIYEMITEKLG